MGFKTYRVWRRRYVAVSAHGCKHEGFDKDFTSTFLTLKARTDKEAQRRAEKIWERYQYGPGSIMAIRDGE